MRVSLLCLGTASRSCWVGWVLRVPFGGGWVLRHEYSSGIRSAGLPLWQVSSPALPCFSADKS
jgi:hypothetical protein